MVTDFIKYLNKRQWIRYDIKNIKGKLKQCDVTPLSKGQCNDIIRYWKGIAGVTVPLYWHEYFYSRNNNFSVKYVPTSFYHSDIIFRQNLRPFVISYIDKCFYDTLFHDVRRPLTIIKNINGYFYDDKKPISIEEATDRIRTINAAVIKPSLEGMWGRGVRVFSSSNGILDNGDNIKDLFLSYGKNFIVQEKLEQHAKMTLLNPTSLNTLRILTYRHGNQVSVLYAVVRIGRSGQSVDNETAGGINADIDLNTGQIKDCAYGTPAEKRIEITDVGTTVKGFEIPSFKEVIAEACDLHLRLPYFNIVGWDFGIDKEGNPQMIEWNRAPDLSQTAHGPAFGDMTEEIVKESLKKPDSHGMFPHICS